MYLSTAEKSNSILNALKNCENEKEFNKIWSCIICGPDVFYGYYSKLKKENNIAFFLINFNWEDYSDFLCQYCSKYLNIWWDPVHFNWCCKYYLCQYCFEHFKIWWDSDKFKFDSQYDYYYLNKYCSNFKNIWGKYYVKMKLLEMKEK